MYRAALPFLALALAAGCGDPNAGGMCAMDSQCSGEVCARDGECLPAADVKMAKLTWTIRGMPASATTCAQSPQFSLTFESSTTDEAFGFEPVPCVEGQFTIDKLPDRFDYVEIDLDARTLGLAPIGADGTAAFDLSP